MISFGPVKRLGFCVGAVCLLLMSCSNQKLDSGAWSPPQEVARSSDSLSSGFTLYRWNGSLLALGGNAETATARGFEQDANAWKTLSTNDLGWLPSAADRHENGLLIARATILRHSVESEFTIGSLAPDGRFKSSTTTPLLLQQAALFPNAPPNLEINASERPGQLWFAGGVLDGLEIRVPYSITGEPVERKGHQVGLRGDLATSANGVFASSDGGRTWRSEPIPYKWSESHGMCRTKAYYYYFAVTGLAGLEPFELWYSRCPVESASWSHPETLNKSVARKLSERLHAVAEDDTVHLCWLDARHEKTRVSLVRPLAGNYEVAYCRRKDSDQGWSKDVILSRGQRWAYAPSISVEQDKLVVAWAGAKADREGRNEWNATDIYFVTSKDGGITWTKPVQVTDGFKNGVTSGRPQVALHRGVIHLFYIQGKLNYKQVSSGMVKLNQPSWPVYYQQRPFPD